MKKPISSIIISLLLFVNVSAQKKVPENSIEWTSDLSLAWSDFQGKPNTDVIAFAETSYAIEIIPPEVKVDENNRVLNFRQLSVKAYFLKDRSWVFKEKDELLKHERLHFDIAELFARKMRKAFQQLQKEGNADFDAYQNVYKQYWRECAKMQRQYDHETSHGRKYKINDQWEVKVERFIQDYKDYEMTD